MKCVALLLLPLPAFGWWCETSDRHGCRGQARHFVREAAVANPFLVFEDIKTYFFQEPIVVDWDGDGNMDLVITGTDKVQFFQRGICKPSASYCKSGVCNQQTSTCKCDAGAEGQDCSLCGHFYVRQKDQCRPCPGYNELAGTCSRRGQGGLRKEPEATV